MFGISLVNAVAMTREKVLNQRRVIKLAGNVGTL